MFAQHMITTGGKRDHSVSLISTELNILHKINYRKPIRMSAFASFTVRFSYFDGYMK